MNDPTIFISYAHEDLVHARRLAWELRCKGYKPWLDENELKGGQRWESTIEAAIRRCNYFVAILSKHSINKRGYVQKELRKALNILEMIPEMETYLIPIRIDESKPDHPRLMDLQWINMYPVWDKGLSKLQDSLPEVNESYDPPTVEFTKWYTYSRCWDAWIFEFRPNGVLAYCNKKVFDQLNNRQQYSIEKEHPYAIDAKWKQKGELIFITIGQDSLLQIHGTLNGNGNEIEGVLQAPPFKQNWKALKTEYNFIEVYSAFAKYLEDDLIEAGVPKSWFGH